MKHLYTFFALWLLCAKLSAQPTIGFQSLATGLNKPVDIVGEPSSSRMFIVEQPGTIRIWNGSGISATPFLNMSSVISYTAGGERGLLSIAFHPQYLTNRYFFVWYTNTSGAVTLARYQRDASNADIADATSGVVLLSVPKSFSNHNGAKLNFGPDGYLYIGTGDGGSANDPPNNAQTGTSLLGKMLRIDVNSFATSAPFYNIPSGNPYTSDANVADEVLALGLRNPWRWSFDRLTGDMWIADVGQGAWEEVNFRAAADISNPGNYGWRCYEGTHTAIACGSTPANNIFPIYEYPHNSSGGYVVTGGYVYRGTEYPALQGYYSMVDYATGNGWLIKSNGSGGWNVNAQTGWPTSITSFGERNDGTLYAITNGGTLYKVTASTPLPVSLLSFTGRKTVAQHQLSWEVQEERTGDNYILERSIGNPVYFSEVGRYGAAINNVYNRYTLAVTAVNQPAYYRLKTLRADGNISLSGTVQLITNGNWEIKVVSNISRIMIESNETIQQVLIADITGRIIYRRDLDAAGMISIPAYNIPKGLLVIRVTGESGVKTTKLLH